MECWNGSSGEEGNLGLSLKALVHRDNKLLCCFAWVYSSRRQTGYSRNWRQTGEEGRLVFNFALKLTVPDIQYLNCFPYLDFYLLFCGCSTTKKIPSFQITDFCHIRSLNIQLWIQKSGKSAPNMHFRKMLKQKFSPGAWKLLESATVSF